MCVHSKSEIDVVTFRLPILYSSLTPFSSSFYPFDLPFPSLFIPEKEEREFSDAPGMKRLSLPLFIVMLWEKGVWRGDREQKSVSWGNMSFFRFLHIRVKWLRTRGAKPFSCQSFWHFRYVFVSKSSFLPLIFSASSDVGLHHPFWCISLESLPPCLSSWMTTTFPSSLSLSWHRGESLGGLWETRYVSLLPVFSLVH